MSADESDIRAPWNAIAYQGQSYTRTITLDTIAAGDSATYKILDAPGGAVKLSLTSGAGIVMTAGASAVISASSGTMAGIAASPRGKPYVHVLAIFTSSGALRAMFAGTFTYAEPERVPL